MSRAYFVVSDLHLCDVEEHADGWKAYKSSRFVFDEVLDAAVRDFLDAHTDDECVVVLNGDILDFDLVTTSPDPAPWPVSGAERRRGLDATDEKSEWKLRRILADHPQFVTTLARVIAEGHRVVYVLGNHDRELHFDRVRRAFAEAVRDRADDLGIEHDPNRLQIEPWFYYVPDEIYVEHGQQYDYYTSFRYVLSPTVPGRPQTMLALPMGNLSNRVLMSEMGFFNPHATDYILNVYRYVVHWLRYYAFSRRNIATRWFFGSIAVMLQLVRIKAAVQRHPPDHDAEIVALARRVDLPADTLRQLDALKRLPITTRWYRVIREFWIDRVLLTALLAGGTVALALSPIPLWIKLMVPLSSFPLLFLIYEWFAHGETVFSAEVDAIAHARSIARLLPTPVVTFGHSHHPLAVPLRDGVTYVNTGTWAPVWGRGEDHTLVEGLRNVLVMRVSDGEAQVDLSSRMP